MTYRFTRWSLLTALLASAAVALATAPAGASASGPYQVKTNLDGRHKPADYPRAKTNFLEKNQLVSIVCQDEGQSLYGSKIWDLVKSRGRELFVPDAFISTGVPSGFTPGIDRCSAKDRARAMKRVVRPNPRGKPKKGSARAQGDPKGDRVSGKRKRVPRRLRLCPPSSPSYPLCGRRIGR